MNIGGIFFEFPVDKYYTLCYNTVETDNTDWRENMPINLSFSGKQDVYLEIARRFEEYIKTGIYKNGDKLPSVRIEAGELGVNPNTVAKAYSYLEEKGLIVALPKKGAFVTYVSENESQNKKNEEIMRAKESISRLLELGMTHDEINVLVKEVLENDQH